MADRKAPGALAVVTEPDYEAMVIGAHPDDDDFAAAGTSALWAKQGKKIVWVVMTGGTEGSEVPSIIDTDLMLTREQEQRMACEVLGVQAVEFLRFHDGHRGLTFLSSIHADKRKSNLAQAERNEATP